MTWSQVLLFAAKKLDKLDTLPFQVASSSKLATKMVPRKHLRSSTTDSVNWLTSTSEVQHPNLIAAQDSFSTNCSPLWIDA
jgi:hypothetical protein